MRIAFENMKYHRSKNILTGIAIVLTTLLLFLVPTVGVDMILAQYEMTNENYPTWHACFSDVDQQSVHEISLHHDIKAWGVYSDEIASISHLPDRRTTVGMYYIDENAAELNKVMIIAGKLPEKENEIVISKEVMRMLHIDGQVGDTITLPYQMMTENGLDYRQEKDFVISGLFDDTFPTSVFPTMYEVFVSDAFLQEVNADGHYYFLFQVGDKENATLEEIKGRINHIAERFHILEENYSYNQNYLFANYVDPAIAATIAVIMMIIMIAGAVTIYSIYYVSMSQRIQEFGRLRAIGASKGQLKRIVLWEGMLVALIAAPMGLLVGTVLTKPVLYFFAHSTGQKSDMASMIELLYQIIREGKITVFHWWIYGLALLVTFFTVYISLIKPMRIAGGVSVIEALRFTGNRTSQRKRKGRENIGIWDLSMNHLSGNRRKSMVTILSMSLTGVLIMVVSTVLSCTSPDEMTEESFLGEYRLMNIISEGDKEHPEWSWSEIVKNNPLDDRLKEQIAAMDGVVSVDAFSHVDIDILSVEKEILTDEEISDIVAEGNNGEDICGIPESYAKEIEKGIIEGSATYEDLKSGENVILDKLFFVWNPELDISVGSTLKVAVHDGDRTYMKKLNVIAISDYRSALHNWNCLIMAKQGADSLCENNINEMFTINAAEKYNKELDDKLKQMLVDVDFMYGVDVRSRQSEYDINKSGLTLIHNGSYVFFGILSVICIMNLVNTMLNSVYIRKKEFGMLQAIGMTDRQLQIMLVEEGLFYTLGTLFVTIGVGSALGYLLYVVAKEEYILGIRSYSYPVQMVCIIVAVLTLIQIFLALVLGKSVKKESLIDRIRFSE
ncbi:MAG: ABC transporter permease [Lachnospiraceae bacterium]|nr:ABC transporter permease [Lachnospiraceae bacterium]